MKRALCYTAAAASGAATFLSLWGLTAAPPGPLALIFGILIIGSLYATLVFVVEAGRP